MCLSNINGIQNASNKLRKIPIGQRSAGGKKAIINPKYVHNIQKNNGRSSPLLVVGKPLANKPSDNDQRHNCNMHVKRHKIPFLNGDFRNTHKATLTSYKASISSFTENGCLCLYSASPPLTSLCDVIIELLTQRTPANCYGNDAVLI